jgi:hypothetical protein
MKNKNNYGTVAYETFCFVNDRAVNECLMYRYTLLHFTDARAHRIRELIWQLKYSLLTILEKTVNLVLVIRVLQFRNVHYNNIYNAGTKIVCSTTQFV